MRELEDPALYDFSPELAWKRVKIRKPQIEYAAIVAAVARWREEKAQELDKPRRRLLKDDAIQEIAAQKPQSEKAFDQLRGVPNGFIRSRNASGLMQAVADAIADPEAHAPDLPKRTHNKQVPAGAPEMLKVLLESGQ